MPTPPTADYAAVLRAAFEAYLEKQPSLDHTISLKSLSGFANEAFAAAGFPELPPMIVRLSVLAYLLEQGSVELKGARMFRVTPPAEQRAAQLAHLLDPEVLTEVLSSATPQQHKVIVDHITEAARRMR